MKIKGYFLASVSAITYGLIPLFMLPIKAIHFSIDVTLAYRFLISSCFVLALVIFKKESLKVSLSELSVLIVLGFLFALSSECLFLAYDYLSAGIASTILFVYPVFVAIIMAVFFREKIAGMTVFSLAITLAGIYLLSTRESLLDINYAGLLIALSSALFYAVYIVTVNKARLNASGIKITFYSLLFSGVFYLVKSLVSNESLLLPNVQLFLNITLFGLTTSLVAILTLVYAIKIIGSTPTAIMGALEPVIAVAISVVLFHEKFTHTLAIGITLILTGVIINILAESRKELGTSGSGN
jgi:drug/metabolite transporter (DMT)-like permease